MPGFFCVLQGWIDIFDWNFARIRGALYRKAYGKNRDIRPTRLRGSRATMQRSAEDE
jgi:hypothetical protein